MARDPVTGFSLNRIKLVISGISGRFRVLLHTGLGSDVDLNGPGPSHMIFTKTYKTLDFSHFRPFSWAIAHGFGVRRGFKWSRTLHTI